MKLKTSYADACSPSGGYEINRILERRIVACVAFLPPMKSISQAGGLMIRKAVWYGEHTSMGMPRMKIVDGQFDEVIPIARHKDTMFRRSIAQLRCVIKTVALYLMNTDDIEAQTAPDLCHSGVDILVQ